MHFAPGEIIQIIGEVPVMWIGISMFIAHSAVGLAGKGRWHFGIALMLSGLGWNIEGHRPVACAPVLMTHQHGLRRVEVNHVASDA